jgi:hypothetical protein
MKDEIVSRLKMHTVILWALFVIVCLTFILGPGMVENKVAAALAEQPVFEIEAIGSVGTTETPMLIYDGASGDMLEVTDDEFDIDPACADDDANCVADTAAPDEQDEWTTEATIPAVPIE